VYLIGLRIAIKQYLNFENEYISSGIWVDEPPDFLDKILGE